MTLERFGNSEQLMGVGLFDDTGSLLAITPGVIELGAARSVALEAWYESRNIQRFEESGDAFIHLYALPVRWHGDAAGAMVVLHDASYIPSRVAAAWRVSLVRLAIQAVLIGAVTLVMVRLSMAGSLAKTADWIKRIRLDGGTVSAGLPTERAFTPLVQEVMHLAKSLTDARAAAKEEARLRVAAESVWTPDRLREHLRHKLHGQALFAISNREPYEHSRRGKDLECIVPASGVVTALEPVLRACGGTWIAHGAGDADRDMVDERDRLRVPPEDPRYTLRRVWLTREEEEGHYDGFSNEGLWPLCHIAHTRPVFKPEDWSQYRAVNMKFARATLEEIEGVREPCVLIQDYHFALLPRLIKEKRPDARVAIFWHIPWPNAEAFAICPWQKELLDGLLGADLLGFHIQFHCNNFLETVDRALESRIDRENFSVNRLGHTTSVKPFPISVAPLANHASSSLELDGDRLKQAALAKLGVKASLLGVGVDRIDYTKGLIERFRGIERFLENHPSYHERLTFVELAKPSRTRIKRYRELPGQVEEEVERINQRFQTSEWRPIVFLKGHHTHEEIWPFYRAADFCLVTSLHDGMNLVAKEYVAARSSDTGVLILSCFAGASRELQHALVINPYDTEGIAGAIYQSLEMSPQEVSDRMAGLRRTVREANVYRWAANLVSELAQVQPERPEVAVSA